MSGQLFLAVIVVIAVLASSATALLPRPPCLRAHRPALPSESCGVIRDHTPRLRPLSSRHRRVQKGNSPCARNEDNSGDEIALLLFGSTGVIGSISAALVLWSEVSVAMTRCGPINLPDWLERSAYLANFAVVAASILARIILGTSLTEFLSSRQPAGARAGSTTGLALLAVAEYFSLVVLLGAVAVVAVQVGNGDALAEGAGLSGIDVNRCRLLLE